MFCLWLVISLIPDNSTETESKIRQVHQITLMF